MSTDRDDLRRLIDLAAGLAPDELADVIDLATLYRRRHDVEPPGHALLDRVFTDPTASARLESMLLEARESVKFQGTIDGAAAIRELRAKYRAGESPA